MTREEYASILVPNVEHDVEYYEEKYPERNLDENQIVTRYAPSPTGFVHIGALLQSFISLKMTKQTNGVCFLRIEDTDQKRTIENGITSIITDLKKFGIEFDEGVTLNGEKGNYGPYIQSERSDIYKAYVKDLIIKDLAYPCFCSSSENEELRQKQTIKKDRIGYYGRYAKCRKLKMYEVIEKIEKGEKYVIRFKSPGDFEKKFKFKDEIKGKMELPENDLDIIILKSDGLPTYHFAHAIDDHLMHTTHVIRGDEWLSSIPIHVQLFRTMGFKVPKYAHISPLLKEDGGTRRKISKRKDPEAAVSFYHEVGIPNEAVMLYLETVANSNFEIWQNQNKDKNPDEFVLDFKKMPVGGTMFDYDKLINISKNYISRLSAEEVYNRAYVYAKEYDVEFANLMNLNRDYCISIFDIERNQKKPRKDIAYFSDVKNQIWYMFDSLFKPESYEWQKIVDKKEIEEILNIYINEYYNIEDDKNSWFENVQRAALRLGFSSDMKAYKENPDAYKGSIADFSTVIRVALTSKMATPDLYEIMKILGMESMKKRIEMALHS